MDLFIRTEDIPAEEIVNYFVETKRDREIIESLKSRNPIVLVGSRGVGKSFLFKMTESELKKVYIEEKILPVYISFNRSSLIGTNDTQKLHHWMLAHMCSRIIRTLSQSGLLREDAKGISVLLGANIDPDKYEESPIETINKKFEDSWKSDASNIDVNALPTTENFKDAVQDLCKSLGIKRFVLLIDEAAHILLPNQQRAFFTLFRDLRSPYFNVNAAVYPGVTIYGDTFQPTHDATMEYYDRNVNEENYIDRMREIVEKQIDNPSQLTNLERNGKNFAILAFAASGNPRILLKTYQRSENLNGNSVNATIREFYKEEIWSEHSALAEKYSGYRDLVDWERNFINNEVLPDIKAKNDNYLDKEKNTTCYFWIHRDSPQIVKEALRLLSYTGIVYEDSSGIMATRKQIGTRYRVNLGCLFALEAVPTTKAFEIAKNLTPKRMTEFGSNHPSYASLSKNGMVMPEPDSSTMIAEQMDKSVSTLDLTLYQKGVLTELGIYTIRQILDATEEKLREAKYIGEKKSRRIKNTAVASVLEYLAG